MPKIKIFLISITGISIFNSVIFLIVGIILSSSPDLIGLDSGRQKDSQIASFVTAGVSNKF